MQKSLPLYRKQPQYMGKEYLPRLLLTGFGSFGPVTSNPSERLILHFRANAPGDILLETMVLPVSYSNGAEPVVRLLYDAELERRPFFAVLMLGVAAGSEVWRLERYGRNFRGDRRDSDGYSPEAGPLISGAPDCLSSSLPIESLYNRLCDKKIPAAISDSAGDYLCNALLFTILNALSNCGSLAKAGFIHVPADKDTAAPNFGVPLFSFPFSMQITAVETALDVLCESYYGEN